MKNYTVNNHWKLGALLVSLFLVLFTVSGCDGISSANVSKAASKEQENQISNQLVLDSIPAYQGEPYVVLNKNQPNFDKKDKKIKDDHESYSDLDSLGRCGTAYATICQKIMPTEERGAIGMIRPSGWHTVKYNDRIDENYLYNRCHLIGYQLAGENANEKNLITGTRYLNVVGMLPFENQVADYVQETNNHVLYRVSPIFKGDNLLASGVQMEAWSIEDKGQGVCFNVYCYNVQPGIIIDYADGDSYADPDYVAEEAAARLNENQDKNSKKTEYILNKNTHKIHLPTCSSVNDMKDKNKDYYSGAMEDLIENGYSPCQRCLK